MHVPRIDVRSLDETVEAVDLGQTPADIVVLSFSDSDLNALAAPTPRSRRRSRRCGSPVSRRCAIPIRSTSIASAWAREAKLIVARVLGGADYWRYGVDELAALARRRGIKLALLPGDRRADRRLEAASTLAPEALNRIWRYFDEGGPDNLGACLAYLSALLGRAEEPPAPAPVAAFGRFERACRGGAPGAPRALIVFYRSHYLADDCAPIEALAEALAGQGFATTAVTVTSLKDEAAVAPLARLIAAEPFDVVLNATAFSARLDDGEGTVLDAADAPVLQVVLAGSAEAAWRANPRGLGPADLAMHVALPEIDGRILTRAVSFKAAHPRDAATEFNAVAHRPLARSRRLRRRACGALGGA